MFISFVLVVFTWLLSGSVHAANRHCAYYGHLKSYSPAVSFCTNSYPIVTTTTQTRKKPIKTTTVIATVTRTAATDTITSTTTNTIATHVITSTEIDTVTNTASTTVTDPNTQQRRAAAATFNSAQAYSKLTNLPSAKARSACICIEKPITVTSTAYISVTATETTTSTEFATETTHTTTTTDVTSTTTKTIHTTAPTVVLASPTPITPVDANGTATSNWDDEFFSLTSPFAIELYGINSTNLTVGVNGWLSLAGAGSYAYINGPLPASNLPDTSYIPLWDDLYVYQGTPQGLYYQVSGPSGSRVFAVEWYTSHYMDSSQYYHFILRLPEANPGTATYQYYQIKDSGNSSTVGAQSLSNNQSVQYSFNTPDITSGLLLHFDDETNTIS